MIYIYVSFSPILFFVFVFVFFWLFSSLNNSIWHVLLEYITCLFYLDEIRFHFFLFFFWFVDDLFLVELFGHDIKLYVRIVSYHIVERDYSTNVCRCILLAHVSILCYFNAHEHLDIRFIHIFLFFSFELCCHCSGAFT